MKAHFRLPAIFFYGISGLVVLTAIISLLSVLSDLPLGMIDAMHLAIAKEIQSDIFATADSAIAAGAEAMGFLVVRFEGPEDH
jgi:predicted nucleic acid-binding protein